MRRVLTPEQRREIAIRLEKEKLEKQAQDEKDMAVGCRFLGKIMLLVGIGFVAVVTLGVLLSEGGQGLQRLIFSIGPFELLFFLLFVSLIVTLFIAILFLVNRRDRRRERSPVATPRRQTVNSPAAAQKFSQPPHSEKGTRMNSQAKTWLTWIAIVAVVAFAFFHSQQKKAAAKAKKEANRAAVVKTVRSMAERYGADSRWMYELVKGHDKLMRFSDVLSIELERLWVTQHPIVFTGLVEDITRGGVGGGYQVVTLKHTELNPKYMIVTPLVLRLEVRDAAKLAELERLARDEDFEFFGSIAFVAKIEKVESSARPGEDGEYETVRVGVGTLIDFTIIPDAY